MTEFGNQKGLLQGMTVRTVWSREILVVREGRDEKDWRNGSGKIKRDRRRDYDGHGLGGAKSGFSQTPGSTLQVRKSTTKDVGHDSTRLAGRRGCGLWPKEEWIFSPI